MKELTNSLKAVLYSRVSSPIYSTFILAWCVYNWEAVLTLLFSEESLKIRIEASKAFFYTDEGFHWGTFWWPVGVTLFFLVVKPILTSIHYAYSEWLKAKAEKKKEEFNASRLLTLEQSQSFISELNRSRETFNNLLVDNEKALAAERNITSKLAEQLDEYQNRINDLLKELSESNATVNEYKEELDNARKEGNREAAKNEISSAKIHSMQQEIKKLEDDLDQSEKRNSYIEGRYECVEKFLLCLVTGDENSLEEVEQELYDCLFDEFNHKLYTYLISVGFGCASSVSFADNYSSYILKNRVNCIDHQSLEFIAKIIDSSNLYIQLEDYPSLSDQLMGRENMFYQAGQVLSKDAD